MSAPRQQLVATGDGTSVAVLTTGAGEPVVLVGGALHTAADYLPLADALAQRCEVHVLERRGRGASGPQGRDYGIDREVEDLRAVLERTGARRVVGHSFGGLVALEAARVEPAIEALALYEPGISSAPAADTAWMERYRRLLDRGDTRGAFACFAQRTPHAPAALRRAPLTYVRLVLRLAIRPAEWRRMEPLLDTNLREHEEVARLAGQLDRYGDVRARMLLLAGAKSPAAVSDPLRELAGGAHAASVETLAGAGHDAPHHQPSLVAEHVLRFFDAPQG